MEISGENKIDNQVRIGGFVKSKSLKQNTNNNLYSFIITDNLNDIAIEYNGILPDLFKEEQGAVVEGTLLSKNKLKAESVFAKHDENYMPAPIKKQLKQANYWKKNY